MKGGIFKDAGSERSAYLNFSKYFKRLGYGRPEILQLWNIEENYKTRTLEEIENAIPKKIRKMKGEPLEEGQKKPKYSILELMGKLNGIKSKITRFTEYLNNAKKSNNEEKINKFTEEINQLKNDYKLTFNEYQERTKRSRNNKIDYVKEFEEIKTKSKRTPHKSIKQVEEMEKSIKKSKPKIIEDAFKIVEIAEKFLEKNKNETDKAKKQLFSFIKLKSDEIKSNLGRFDLMIADNKPKQEINNYLEHIQSNTTQLKDYLIIENML